MTDHRPLMTDLGNSDSSLNSQPSPINASTSGPHASVRAQLGDSVSAPLSLNSQPSSINASTSGPHASVRAQLGDSVSAPLSLNPQPSTLNHCVRAQVAVHATPDSTDADILHIRVSDETLDRYKEVIVASGWRLENYLRNPVIQNAHQYGDIIFTIGRAEETWVSGNALLQTWRFASNENPFAKIARDLYRGKFLQAASVGFVPLKWEDADPDPAHNLNPNLAFTRRYLEQELLEVSAVGIPANPNALTLALKAGAVEQSDLRELFALLKHLVGRTVPGEPRSASSDSSYPSDSSLSVAKLLPQLRSILLTINRKENL